MPNRTLISLTAGFALVAFLAPAARAQDPGAKKAPAKVQDPKAKDPKAKDPKADGKKPVKKKPRPRDKVIKVFLKNNNLITGYALSGVLFERPVQLGRVGELLRALHPTLQRLPQSELSLGQWDSSATCAIR